MVNIRPEDKKVALILKWIELLLCEQCPTGDLFGWLKSGVVLLRLLNTVKPGLCKSIYEGSIGYKQIENVQKYLKLCPIVAGLEVPLFSVADLTDQSDLNAVTSHLHAMISIIQRDAKWSGPTLDSARQDMKHNTQPSSSASTTVSSSETQEYPSKPNGVQEKTHRAASESKVEMIAPSQAESSSSSSFHRHAGSSSSVHHSISKEQVSSSSSSESTSKASVEAHHGSHSNTHFHHSHHAHGSSTSIDHQPQRNPAHSKSKTAPTESAMTEAPMAPTSSTTSASNLTSTVTRAPEIPLNPLSEQDVLEKARKELEAERLAMAEERRLFAERVQAETELRLKEMAKKLEEETAAAIAKERRMSVAMSVMLEEEKRAREKVARELEEERKTRLKLFEDAERQKQEYNEQAQQQMLAVAEKLQEKLHEETSKKLEAMASKITADALQKAEKELRKKDEHLMKQMDRERMLRSRLDALEEEKKSLARTFERKFASMESDLKSAKAASIQPKTSTLTAATGTKTETGGGGGAKTTTSINVDPDTLEAFKEWNSKWKSNRALTKQLTLSLNDMGDTSISATPATSKTEAAGTVAASGTTITTTLATKKQKKDDATELDPYISTEPTLRLGSDEDQPLALITPRSDADEGKTAESYEEDDGDEVLDEGDEEEDDKFGSGAGAEDAELDKKQWLDDDWSEEEDWESDRDFSDDDQKEQGEDDEDGEEDADQVDSKAPSKKPTPISPKSDEWSQFSSMNLSKYS